MRQNDALNDYEIIEPDPLTTTPPFVPSMDLPPSHKDKAIFFFILIAIVLVSAALYSN